MIDEEIRKQYLEMKRTFEMLIDVDDAIENMVNVDDDPNEIYSLLIDQWEEYPALVDDLLRVLAGVMEDRGLSTEYKWSLGQEEYQPPYQYLFQWKLKLPGAD